MPAAAQPSARGVRRSGPGAPGAHGFDLVLVARGRPPMRRQLERQLLVCCGKTMKRALLWLIRFYRSAISPDKGAMCKYIPTCSQYGLEAIERAFKGGF